MIRKFCGVVAGCWLAIRTPTHTKFFHAGLNELEKAKEKAVAWADGQSDVESDTDEEGPADSGDDECAHVQSRLVAAKSASAAVAALNEHVSTSSSSSSSSDE